MPPMAAYGYRFVQVAGAECSAREYFEKSNSLREGACRMASRIWGDGDALDLRLLYSRVYRNLGMRRR